MFSPRNKLIIRRNPAAPVSSSTGRRGGFTLIITIILIAFLVLLMVSMASLTRVELQVATNYQQADTARQNALVALDIALGQLQAAAGPDQRVTARAEILDSTPATASVDNVNQPYWTGVWKTGSAPLDLTDQPGFTVQRTTSLGSTSPSTAQKVSNAAAWLVSRPTISTVDPTTAELTVADNLSEGALSVSAAISGVTGGAAKPTAAVLAKKYGRQDPSALPNESTNPGFIVAAPLVDLTGTPFGFTSATPIGRYAYWVGDEGLKAKVNLSDATLGLNAEGSATATTAQTHFLAPQANAIHKIFYQDAGGKAVGLVKDKTKDYRSENGSDLDKVIAPNSLAFLSTTPVGLNLKPYQPDVTVYSQGVLADVKNGGLKKDLTAAFETPSEYTKLTGGVTDYGYQENMLYRNYPGQTIPYFASINSYTGLTDGLPWTALHGYYNTYKSRMDVPSTSFPVNSSAIYPEVIAGSLTSLPYELSPRILSYDCGGMVVNQGGMFPELLGFAVDVALNSKLDTSSGKWKLYLELYPSLTIYNPYNCRLKFTGFTLGKYVFSAFRDAATGSNYCINVDVGGVPVATKIPLSNRGSGQYYLEIESGQSDTLEPGETRVFGVAGADGLNSGNYLTWGLARQLVGRDYAKNKAQYTVLPAKVVQSGGDYNEDGLYAGTSNGDDEVKVGLTTLSGAAVSKMKIRAHTQVNGAARNLFWPSIGAPHLQVGEFVLSSEVESPPSWQPIRIKALAGNPRLISGMRIRKKGLFPDRDTPDKDGAYKDGAYSGSRMAIPLFHGNAPAFSFTSNYASTSWDEFYANGEFGDNYSGTDDINPVYNALTTYSDVDWGGRSMGLDSSALRKVLRDVPGQPLVSLGQFMHMPSLIKVDDQNFGQRDVGSMAVGGSLCSPFISTGNTILVYGGSKYILDDSFLANDNLFDRFYFSTMPPAVPAAPVPHQWNEFAQDSKGASWSGNSSKSLPNSRMQPYSRNGVAPAMADLRDFDQAAANLLLNGAFNVNSTSVDAWKVLLSSLSGNDLRVFNPLTNTAQTIPSSTLKNPIPRFWGSSTNTGGAWDGARALTDTEVTMLAKSIVQQVKTRGPFLSMSDFLNRRLGPDSALTRAGCLQAAIDDTNLNDEVKKSGVEVNASGGGLYDLTGYAAAQVIAANLHDGAGKPLNTTVGMPGYLMQQDIIQAFSPAMTVRSDTFVIRTYGESVNPSTGLPQSKAWAEAVVQRVPEFLDPANADATPLATLNANNTTFGRRFKVVSFRWLSPSDL